MALWLVNGLQLPLATRTASGGGAQPGTASLSVNEVILAYFHHAQTYYRHKDGSPTSEVDNLRLALRWVKNLYGHTHANDFDSLALEAIRGAMLRGGLCRDHVNKDVARIKRAFRWASARNLVPVSVFQSLRDLEGLRAGHSEARETEPVRAVEWSAAQPVLPHVSRQVAAMLELQYHTGMRPGEVCIMHTIDIDRSSDVIKHCAVLVRSHRDNLRITSWRFRGENILG